MSSTPSLPLDIERARLKIVLVTISVSLIWVTVMATQPWSDGRTAVLLSLINLTIFVTHIVRRRDRALARLLIFGIGLGGVELVADALCIRFTGTLDYSPAHSTPVLLSPWWMPVAWMLVSTQIGYLGAWLIERRGVFWGASLSALIGALNIPFYEEMAYHAHWWRYQNCRQIGHTPLYIIVAELIIGLALGPLACRVLRNPSASVALWLGVLGGGVTIIGGILGYGFIERVLPWLSGESPFLLP